MNLFYIIYSSLSFFYSYLFVLYKSSNSLSVQINLIKTVAKNLSYINPKFFC